MLVGGRVGRPGVKPGAHRNGVAVNRVVGNSRAVGRVVTWCAVTLMVGLGVIDVPSAVARTHFAIPPTVAPVSHAAHVKAGGVRAMLASASVGTTVSVGKLPTGVATTDSTAYVTNSSDNTLSVVDLASGSVTATIPVGSFPNAVALNTTGTTAYVANFKGNSLSIVNLTTDAAQTVPVGSHPDGVIQVGSLVYVANLTSGTISVVDPSTASVTGTITLPGTSPEPSEMASSSDGHTLYVNDVRYSRTDVVDLVPGPPAAESTGLTVGTYPAYIAVHGTTGYVANATAQGATPGSVSVLNLATKTVTATISVGAHPYGIAAVPSLSEVLVANSGDNNMNVIDTTNNTVLATATLGTTPDAVAVTPNQRTAIISNEGDNTVTIVRVNTLARLSDQTGGATIQSTNSQNYESQYSRYDDQAADDFQVAVTAPSISWRITGVVANGSYANATPPGPADSFNVYVYADTASHLPGALVFSQIGIPQIADDATGDVTLPLSPAATLAPGRYWLSVQANQTFSTHGGWFWDDRAPQTLSPAAWQQPGNSSGLGCPTWGVRYVCEPLSTAAYPDQAFALIGGESSSPGAGTAGASIQAQSLAAPGPAPAAPPGAAAPATTPVMVLTAASARSPQAAHRARSPRHRARRRHRARHSAKPRSRHRHRHARDYAMGDARLLP